MRKGGIDALHIRQMHLLHDVERARLRLSCRQIGVHAQHLFNLFTDPQHRVQRRHRLLKDHRHAFGAQLAHLRRAGGGDLHLLEVDAPAGDLKRALGQQPHGRQRGHRFARAAFAHQAQGFTGTDVDIDAAQDRIGLAGAAEADGQAANGQNLFRLREVLGFELHLMPPVSSDADPEGHARYRPEG